MQSPASFIISIVRQFCPSAITNVNAKIFFKLNRAYFWPYIPDITVKSPVVRSLASFNSEIH